MPRQRVNRRTTKLGTVVKDHDSWYAKYRRNGVLHRPGGGFSSFALADRWLAEEQWLIDRGEWTPPAERRAIEQQQAITLGEYACEWIEHRTTAAGRPLADSTVNEYHRYLAGRLASLTPLPLNQISRERVEQWWEDNKDAPAMRRDCYALMKSVMSAAEDAEIIERNPCRVPNASRRAPNRPEADQRAVVLAMTPEKVQQLSQAIDPRWSALIVLLAYSGLRIGEALALNRSDLTCSEVDGMPRWKVSVRRTIARDRQGKHHIADTTKTEESQRDIPIPPHVAVALVGHMEQFTAAGRNAPVFPSTPRGLNPATSPMVWGSRAKKRTGADAYRRKATIRPATGFAGAVEQIGLPDTLASCMRVHDLRRVAQHLFAQAGMGDIDSELMVGHKLPAVQRVYRTWDPDSLWPVMDELSRMAGWTPPSAPHTPLQALPDAPVMDDRFWARMTPEQLRPLLARKSNEQLDVIIPLLSPEQLDVLTTKEQAR